MAKPKNLIPAPRGDGFKADVVSAVEGLFNNGAAKSFDIAVDKKNRTARIRAVAEDGRSSLTNILAPGLVATINNTPGTKKSFEKSVAALFHQGYSQTESGHILDCSQAHISNTQRRLGLR
ncbi:hypothetical protein SFC76_19320 [Sphingomonas sp. CD22]|uniref:hypothetical protein n=1 Tax=Sphingomonas sp. CD22 TaxID=3100214 RepID=UPI002ADFBD70|nr:hypothetical protein [Sphingomonas sp. CD22]MEA1086429.1 hypothetical protein [Sphingomonas sp. CD22]